MANFFYYDANGTKQGPIAPQELQDLVVQGIVTPQTPLETDTGHKGKAGQIKGLQFPDLMPREDSEPTDPFTETIPQPRYQQPRYQQPQSTGLKSPVKDCLIWSIFTTICCFPLAGIIGIVMSIQAKSALQRGDYADYESKNNIAFWCNLIGLILGVLSWAVIVIFIAATGPY